jgi:hypothetical protein
LRAAALTVEGNGAGTKVIRSLFVSTREHVWPLAFVLAIALLCAQLSFRLRAETLAESYGAEFDVLLGRTRSEFQNRLLGPGLLATLRALFPESVGPRSLWYLFRFLQAAASFAVLYWAAFHLTGRRVASLLAVALVAYAYLWTPMTHYIELTGDFFDILFAALFVVCVLEQRWAALTAVVVLAALNRESATFAGILCAAVVVARYGIARPAWPRIALGLSYTALAAALVAGVRVAMSETFQPAQQIGILTTLETARTLLHPTGLVPMLAATTLPFAVLLARLPRPWMPEQKAIGAAVLVCFAITLVFGIISELRILLPLWTMLALLIVLAPTPRTDRQWVDALLAPGAAKGPVR